MLVFLTTLLAILPSILRSRAALELENMALRHQIGVLQRSAAKRPKLTSGDRPFVDLPLPPLARLALSAGHRQARNGRGLASCRLSTVLDLEGAARPAWTTGHFARGPRSNPPDVPGESHLGCTPHSWRTAQTRHPSR